VCNLEGLLSGLNWDRVRIEHRIHEHGSERLTAAELGIEPSFRSESVRRLATSPKQTQQQKRKKHKQQKVTKGNQQKVSTQPAPKRVPSAVLCETPVIGTLLVSVNLLDAAIRRRRFQEAARLAQKIAEDCLRQPS
jgi:hypothetical protein